jgi:prevent-host-death family protein
MSHSGDDQRSPEVSVRELRNRTADVVRRIEAGEKLALTVNRRPVADIVPHDQRPQWAPSSAVRAIAAEAPADRALLTDLHEPLGQTVDEL